MVKGSKSSFSQLFAMSNFVFVFLDFWDLAPLSEQITGFPKLDILSSSSWKVRSSQASNFTSS